MPEKESDKDVNLKMLGWGMLVAVSAVLINEITIFETRVTFPISVKVIVYIIALVVGLYGGKNLLKFRPRYDKWIIATGIVFFVIGANYITSLSEIFISQLNNSGLGNLIFSQIVILMVVAGIIVLYINVLKTRRSKNWQTLRSKHSWEIMTPDGSIAKVKKSILAESLRNNIRLWSDLISGTDASIMDDKYKTPNGRVVEIWNRPEGYIIQIELSQKYDKGDSILFKAEREIREVFTSQKAWVQVFMNSPKVAGPLEMEVFIPEGLDVKDAIKLRESRGRKIIVSTLNNAMSEIENPSGKKKRIHFYKDKPKSGWKYTIFWEWKR